jgi:hypothetical protein
MAALRQVVARQLRLAQPPPALARTAIPGRVTPTPKPQAGDDVSALADSVRARLDPITGVRAGLTARIPALDDILPDGALSARLTLAPRFDDPLYADLLAVGAHWIMPGVESLGANRVRLLAVDDTFVGAFLIGANHALAQELLWRGYPVDPRATFFHRFWDRVDTGGTDLDDLSDLAGWELTQTIRENMGGRGEAMTAIVVRAELVRRYPTAHWFLQPARQDRQGAWVPAADGAVEVAFAESLDAETAVYGFDLPPDQVRGDRANGVPGYFVAIEEQPCGPRFGLDPVRRGQFETTPSAWDNLAWGHLVDSQAQLDALTHAPVDGARLAGFTLDGTTWGENSAHQARATWQRPFRMLIHADALI